MNIRKFSAIALTLLLAETIVLGATANALTTPTATRSTTATPSLKMSAKNKKGKKAAASAPTKEIDPMQVFDPKFPDESSAPVVNKKAKVLQGTADYVEVGQGFGLTVHNLTQKALDRDEGYVKASAAVDKYRTTFQRALRATKDAVNYVYPYRGFSMSMEGSRVLLDKNQKLNNLCLAEMTKQRYWDEMHPKVMAKIMQISMGLGIEDPHESEVAVKKGLDGLSSLVGPEAAQQTLAELSDWNNVLDLPTDCFNQPVWDVETTERVYQNALSTSANGDPMINYIFKTLKKFDHSKLANMAAGMIEANLSAITVLSGNPFASLAAEGANTAFVMATGGPEENKILKELYFGRRLEIRRKRISDETELAINNYEKALLTHNPAQLAMSEMVLGELIGPEKIATVLERDPSDGVAAANAIESAPIELAKTNK